jgi:hypothetical protein
MKLIFALSAAAMIATASPSLAETRPSVDGVMPTTVLANGCHPRYGCPDDHVSVPVCLSFIAMIYGLPCDFL